MTPLNQQAWDWLERELDTWGDLGMCASFWWRDDDAAVANSALNRLCALSNEHRAPLAVAIIPANAESVLALLIEGSPACSVLQHGYAHQNHAAAGQRNIELGGQRAHKDIIADLSRGMQRLEGLFGDRYVPVLVPPWNRIDAALIGALVAIGFCGISTAKARRNASPAKGLLQVNTHLDPIHWRYRRGFIGIYPAIALLMQHLQARRLGYRQRDEPTGLLTHHLVQQDAVWQFVEQLLRFVQAHPAACWLSANEIWREANPE